MKVIQLIDSLDAGGAERMAVNIANGLNDFTDTSFICATRREGILKSSIKNLENYFFLEKSSKLDVKAFTKLISFIKNHQINIIHAHSSSFFTATIVKLFVPRVKLIWHDHYGKSEDLENRRFKILKYCSLLFNYIISVNDQLKQWAMTSLKCQSVVYLRNFTIPIDQEPQTKLNGIDNYRMICLANLRPQKDQLTLIKAFKQISSENHKWSLHLVGKDFEDDYSLKIKELITELNLNDRIFLYGSCPDVAHILSQCNIGLLASNSEGLPLALLEYGLAKLPVIATNVGDCNKVLVNNTMGILIEPNNVDQLISAINIYLEDELYKQNCSTNLNQHILTNFSQQKYLKSVLSIYQSVLSK